jgi:hypothetical protein
VATPGLSGRWLELVLSSHDLGAAATHNRCCVRTKAAARAPAAYAHRAGNPDRPARRRAHRTGAIAASPKRWPAAGRLEHETDRPRADELDARLWGVAGAESGGGRASA